MKKLSALIILFILTGCVSQAKTVSGTVKSEPIYRPVANVVSSVSLGETMMYQALGWNVDCISPTRTKSDTFSMGMFKIEIKANEKICADSIGSNVFNPEYDVITPANGASYTIVEVRKKDGTSDLCPSGYTSYCLNYQSDEISRGTEFKSAMNSLQQSIEYMGREGDTAKFLYTEFKDGMARSAFNREFIVDLTAGSSLNFKGAEVEIINATNTTLEYRVKNYFNL